MYSEMNELFKIILIQLTRMFFLSKLPIIHFHSSFSLPPPPPPNQQLKRVFKHVLYLSRSIIIIFDFEKMNVLRWPVPIYMRVGYVFDLRFSE